MPTIDTDICIIGGGSGGLSVAAGAAQMGARVVLIESAEMGGDCLNHGCVPSKALIAAAARAPARAALQQAGAREGAPAAAVAVAVVGARHLRGPRALAARPAQRIAPRGAARVLAEAEQRLGEMQALGRVPLPRGRPRVVADP